VSQVVTASGKKRLGILGGSFNPVHVVHLRLALEALEQAGLDRVDFLPAYQPPHKQKGWMLPFEDRARILEETLQGRPRLAVNRMEAERSGPSYTVHSLEAYLEREPRSELCFILGGDEFLFLPEWYEWRRLLGLSNLVVAAREEGFEAKLASFVREHLPQAQPESGSPRRWLLPEGRSIHFIEMPRMDVSSTLIRKRWSQGRSLAWLVPAAVEAHLAQLKNWTAT
jgi:nicotinate-nucleotide adenylyltransferase